MAFEKDKFSFAETMNNSNGKTSGSGFCGTILIITGCICFILSMIGWMFLKLPDSTAVMNNVIMLLVVGGGLLGVRKVFDRPTLSDDKDKPTIEANSNIG